MLGSVWSKQVIDINRYHLICVCDFYKNTINGNLSEKKTPAGAHRFSQSDSTQPLYKTDQLIKDAWICNCLRNVFPCTPAIYDGHAFVTDLTSWSPGKIKIVFSFQAKFASPTDAQCLSSS